MKKENDEDLKSLENAPAPEASAKLPKEKNEKKTKEKKPSQVDGVQLPVLVELTYSVSVILLIFVSLAVITVSVLTGVSLLNLVIRTSVTILALGSLLILISSQVSSGVLQASLVEQEEFQKMQSADAEIPEGSEAQEAAEA
jgi:hypothetical protein